MTLSLNESFLLFTGLLPETILILKTVAASWALFSIPYFLGVWYFERNQKRRAALLFYAFGIAGLFFATGFFAAAAIAIWTGHIAMSDHWKDMRAKKMGVPVHHEITEEHIAALKKRPRRRAGES